MSALIPLVLIILVSFGCGYGVRALMSKRRRAAERQWRAKRAAEAALPL